MNDLTVTITKEDFANAPKFNDPERCPLANALNRQFGNMGIWRCGVVTARLNLWKPNMKTYLIPNTWGRLSNLNSIIKIEGLIDQAKAGENVEDVILTLKPAPKDY
jgi:hypothetical protein